MHALHFLWPVFPCDFRSWESLEQRSVAGKIAGWKSTSSFSLPYMACFDIAGCRIGMCRTERSLSSVAMTGVFQLTEWGRENSRGTNTGRELASPASLPLAKFGTINPIKVEQIARGFIQDSCKAKRNLFPATAVSHIRLLPC